MEVKCNFLKIYKEKCKALNLIKAPPLIDKTLFMPRGYTFKTVSILTFTNASHSLPLLQILCYNPDCFCFVNRKKLNQVIICTI